MKKYINHSSIRFVIAGGLNTGLTYIVYLTLLLIMPYKIAYTLSFLTGIGLGYIFNATFVFRRKPVLRTASLYPFVYLVQYVMGILLLSLFVEKISLDEKIAPILVVIVSLPVMYYLTRLLFSIKLKYK